ncbi:MoxR-like ATPase [Rhodopseudomonas rhenobacensis]|uniref:MoxR-like ATPase n=1 Tax=Rhodopseudomonas rhenobacensis TaxID=87461 RepID=A0A7W8DZS5_9BRAD|nr:MoxR family ATPase [Rhodopseudomonas rhenobacensis]MBB5047136.1 MoxR-like ATPase [Rhodopseudomonas rhenobacensis]
MAGEESAGEDGVDLAAWRDVARQFEAELGKAILGQQRVIRLLTVAIFARGHVLLEGDVGVGKTTLLRAAARCLGGSYERIEGTIDLMPADLVYYTFLGEDGRPRVEPGPVLRRGEDLAIFFFNEINRARPQVHSLLLRLMAERTLSAFNRDYAFPHLLVFADRNRIEREETFELPAAARDRFLMEIAIDTPADPEVRRCLMFDTRFHDADRLVGALRQVVPDHRALDGVGRAIQQHVGASEALQHYALRLWDAVRYPGRHGITLAGLDSEHLVEAGASPRGMSFLLRAARVVAWLDGRDKVVPEDLREVFFEVMAHRIFLDPIHEMRRAEIMPGLISQLFETVPAP